MRFRSCFGAINESLPGDGEEKSSIRKKNTTVFVKHSLHVLIQTIKISDLNLELNSRRT